MNPSARTGAAKARKSAEADRRRARIFTSVIWREAIPEVSEHREKFVKKMSEALS
jgi:hypothetical protein